jgi:L-alanine-DL-glutamate epimerase-like enolase superfamily enzyme
LTIGQSLSPLGDVPEAPGIGVELSDQFIEKYRIEQAK